MKSGRTISTFAKAPPLKEDGPDEGDLSVGLVTISTQEWPTFAPTTPSKERVTIMEGSAKEWPRLNRGKDGASTGKPPVAPKHDEVHSGKRGSSLVSSGVKVKHKNIDAVRQEFLGCTKGTPRPTF